MNSTLVTTASRTNRARPHAAVSAGIVEHLEFESLEDDALWRLTQDGHHDAFEILVHRHAKAIHNHLRRLGASVEDAQDLGQETFLRAHRFRRHYSNGSLTAWFRRLARNLFYDWYRAHARREQALAQYPAAHWHEPDALSSLERADRLRRVERLASQVLSPNEFRVLRGRLRGLSNPEIASETGISPQAVRVHVSNGLRRLRDASD